MNGVNLRMKVVLVFYNCNNFWIVFCIVVVFELFGSICVECEMFKILKKFCGLIFIGYMMFVWRYLEI